MQKLRLSLDRSVLSLLLAALSFSGCNNKPEGSAGANAAFGDEVKDGESAADGSDTSLDLKGKRRVRDRDDDDRRKREDDDRRGEHDRQPPAPQLPNIVQLAMSQPKLSTLVSLLTEYPNLVKVLSSPGNYTVFAPTNEAFAKIDASKLTKDEIETVLKYHIATERKSSADLKAAQPLPMANNQKTYVVKDQNSVVINAASKVVAADVQASNGIVHVVDTVLIPDSLGTIADALVKRYFYTTLVGAAKNLGLVQTLATAQNITVFAPHNGAFHRIAPVVIGLPQDAVANVIKYHVLPQAVKSTQLRDAEYTTLLGKKFRVDLKSLSIIDGTGKARALIPSELDVVTKNGVIHGLQDVLFPAP